MRTECGKPCGPTNEQVMDAMARGDVMGTWDRCEDCAERERELLKDVKFLPRSAVTETVDYAPIKPYQPRPLRPE